jgi:hypothetical protein
MREREKEKRGEQGHWKRQENKIKSRLLLKQYIMKWK